MAAKTISEADAPGMTRVFHFMPRQDSPNWEHQLVASLPDDLDMDERIQRVYSMLIANRFFIDRILDTPAGPRSQQPTSVIHGSFPVKPQAAG